MTATMSMGVTQLKNYQLGDGQLDSRPSSAISKLYKLNKSLICPLQVSMSVIYTKANNYKATCLLVQAVFCHIQLLVHNGSFPHFTMLFIAFPGLPLQKHWQQHNHVCLAPFCLCLSSLPGQPAEVAVMEDVQQPNNALPVRWANEVWCWCL